MKNGAHNYIYNSTAVVVLWGATASNYTNIGMSIAIITFVLFFAYTMYKKSYPKDFSLDNNIVKAFLWVYGLLFIASLFHLDNLRNLYGGGFSLISFIQYTFPMWMIIYIGWNKDVSKSLICVFSVIVYSMCLYGIGEYHVKHMNRLDSFYASPTFFGLLLDICIPFTVSLLFYFRKSKIYMSLIGGMLCAEIYSLVLTETRGSFFALSVAAFFTLGVFITKGKPQISRLKKLIIVLFTCVFIGAAGVYTYHIGTESSARMMGEERPLMWAASVQMWKDHKLAGIGISEWKNAWDGPYRAIEAKETTNVMPHNMPLYFLSTSGIIGFGGYLLFNIYLFIYFLKSINTHGNNPFTWGMFAIFIAYTAHGMLDATFISKPTSRLFYVIFGISLLFIHWGKVSYLSESKYNE